jgi:hypothetical protein
MMPRWKQDWPQARARIQEWWEGRGFVVGTWGGVALSRPHADLQPPEVPATLAQQWTDIGWRAAQARGQAAWTTWPLETLPVVDPWFGPGSLALCLGSPPGWERDTVWFGPTIMEPDTHPPLELDTENTWWKAQMALIEEMMAAAAGDYYVGCPDLVEHWDILGSLRDTQMLLMDMIERPAWVQERIEEIERAWFAAYERLYAMLRVQDGMFGWFRTWAPGKVAKLQCDGSSMFSPAMFREFVQPALRRQCQWLDRSLYHLDGSQCLCHLEALLEIEELDAIEWTPDPRAPSGGSPHWYGMYRRILGAGKRVQVLGASAAEIPPLLDAVGTDGVNFLCFFSSEKEAEEYERVVGKLRA